MVEIDRRVRGLFIRGQELTEKSKIMGPNHRKWDNNILSDSQEALPLKVQPPFHSAIGWD